jgi:hypothetical protein
MQLPWKASAFTDKEDPNRTKVLKLKALPQWKKFRTEHEDPNSTLPPKIEQDDPNLTCVLIDMELPKLT